jgi:hypothetical protein
VKNDQERHEQHQQAVGHDARSLLVAMLSLHGRWNTLQQAIDARQDPAGSGL